MIVVIYETLKDFQFDIRGILRRNIKEFFYPFFLSFFLSLRPIFQHHETISNGILDG